MSSSDQEQPTIQPKQQTAQQTTQPQTVKTKPSKPVNQTKNTASYTYWVDDKNKSRQLPPQQRPQKIDPPKVINQKVEDGRSQWNTAGTWQHRKVNITDIQKLYSQKINQWLEQISPQTKINKLSLSGQCQVVFTRNKKGLTYQITGKIEFQKNIPQPQEHQNTKNNAKQQTQPQKDNESDSLDLSGDDKSDNEGLSKQQKKKSKELNTTSLTFEIVDLTDHGDRQHKSSADVPQDKKWLTKQSEKLLTILEDVLKSYK